MKQFMLYAACALLVCSIAAHPNFGRRHDLVDDDEPFARDADSDFDLIAEESEHYDTVVATELTPTPVTHTRGRVRFSTADNQESVSNHRYTSSNRYRSRKTSTTATPISSTQEPVESEKDERALMLVLPYDTRNLSESKIQELYTKAPMTWIINTTTTQKPITKPQTERTSTTVVVTPTPEIKYYRKRITTTTTTQAPPPIRDNVKDVLASIGLFPDKQQWKPVTTTQTPEFVKIATDSFSPDMVNLLASFGLMPSDSKNEIPPPSAPEEEPEQFDIPQSQPSFQAEIDPSSYSVFKPIPRAQEKQALSSDMKEFLASFGIVDDDNMKKETRPRGKQLLTRTEVTASPSEIPTLHPESMSDDMKEVLHSLGLVPHLTPEEITEKTTFQSRSINSEYIFNPTDSVHNSLNNSEDVENLKKLLDAFKSLASNTSTPEEIEKQLQEANLSQQNFTSIFGNNNNNVNNYNNNDKHSLTLDKYTNAPDPLSFEELLYAINETKNEIHKRQEAKNTSDILSFDTPSSSTGSPTTVRTSTTSTTTTTEEPEDEPEESDSKNAASETKVEETSIGASSTTENNAALLADLESSFGGNTGSSTIDEELPPARPNGFYFMLDWNSFLNVGEDDKGVNLKFAPRLGNSRNFLPITVP